jgi:dephospho-CoA kinase
MINIGLTGGMASGKNFIASVFEQLGCYTIDADILSRSAIAPGGIAARPLFDVFGNGILSGVSVEEYINCDINAGAFQREYESLRAVLRKIVSNNPEKLKALEQIIHPAVAALYIEERKKILRKNSSAVIVYHAPLLIEVLPHGLMGAAARACIPNRSDIDSRIGLKPEVPPFDAIVLIWASRETVLKRLAARGHPPMDEALKLLDAQMSYEEKCRFADHIIDNNGDKETAHRDTERVYNLIKFMV